MPLFLYLRTSHIQQVRWSGTYTHTHTQKYMYISLPTRPHIRQVCWSGTCTHTNTHIHVHRPVYKTAHTAGTTAVKELVPKGIRALCMFHIQMVYKAEKCTVSKTEIFLCTLGVQDIPKPGLTHSVSKRYTQHTLIISKPWHCCRVPKSFSSRATDA